MLRSAVLALTLAAVSAPFARADEPYIDFLEGLRDLRYYEYALLYLDGLRDDPNVPADVRAVIPYEKATTLLAKTRSSVIRSPEVQALELDKALGFLKQFTTDSPNHPKAAEANTERARILLGRARVEVWQSRSPGNRDNRITFQDTARKLVAEARAIFQAAHDGHKANWEGFPKYIDRVEKRQLFEQRRQAEIRYIMAQLDLSNCTYEEGQTFDRDSEEFGAKLRDAAKEYEGVHEKYRQQVGGLYARLWQGKCFEEQDDIQRAVGLYKELLGHPGKSDTMRRLQSQTLQFYLICLNHDSRKDYQLVIDKGNEWLKSVSARQRVSPTATGIQWEMVLALESLAKDRAIEESAKKRLIGLALSVVKKIKPRAGQYKDLATFKERDLKVLLDGGKGITDPEDFDTAFSLAAEMVTRKTKELNAAIKAAETAEERKNALLDRDLHLEACVHMLRIALRLADDNTPIHEVNLARQYLAYTYLLSRTNYEAAILAEFVAMNYGKDNPVLAQDAAYLAMAAYVQAFNDNEKAERHADQEIDVAQMSQLAELLVAKWPASDRAMDARIQMGSVNGQLKKFQEAARWYSQIPSTSSKFMSAQTQAGQSYWSAYIEAAGMDQLGQPPKEQLDEWMASAEAHLRSGIEQAEANTPPDSAAPDALIAAKVSLVQILVAARKYPEAITILTGDPHSVQVAIQVGDERARPKAGGTVKSVPFASLVYQLLLRCYVGVQDLDSAQVAMEKLEAVGGNDGAALTAIYQQLGKELENELERLKALGQLDAYNEVRTSFETFLKKMADREAQTVGSLTWIAVTYFGLAEGSKDAPSEATAYFESAGTTYQTILDRAGADPEFIDPSRLTSVRLRLANCRRHQGEFEAAEELVKAILEENRKAKKNNLDVQLEANYIHQAWGSEKGMAEHFRTAMRGDKDANMWGWGQTALRLQGLLDSGKPGAEEKYRNKFYESRHAMAVCRLEFGKVQNQAKKTEEIERAIIEINSFVRITADFDDEWFDKFAAVYLQCYETLGRVPVELERALEYQPQPEEEEKPNDEDPIDAIDPTKVELADADDEGGSEMAFVIFGVFGLIGLGGAGFMVMKGSKGRRSTPELEAAAAGVAPTIAPPSFTPPPAGPAAPVFPGAAPAGAPKKKRKLTDDQKRALLAKKKRAAAAAAAAAGGDAGAAKAAPKKKRPLTPEEKEILIKRKRAKAAAEAKKKKQAGE
jgi:tetratricopeptide (TPR) repeat protein